MVWAKKHTCIYCILFNMTIIDVFLPMHGSNVDIFCMVVALIPHKYEITSSPLPWLFAITPTQGPHPDRQDKMSELLKSHDSFVLRKSPHAQISRPNRAILPNNDTIHPCFTQTIVQMPQMHHLQQKSVVFLLRKLAAILWKLAQEEKKKKKRRGTPLFM